MEYGQPKKILGWMFDDITTCMSLPAVKVVTMQGAKVYGPPTSHPTKAITMATRATDACQLWYSKWESTPITNHGTSNKT